jgi:cytochrome c-type biogenesis protein CcmH
MTLLFWLIATVTVAAVLLSVLRPLLKQDPVTQGHSRDNRLSVYRQQFTELEQDRNAGMLNEEQYQEARRELERRLLEETEGTVKAPIPSSQSQSQLVPLTLAVVIPLASMVLYLKLGTPAAITHPSVSALSQPERSDDRHQTVAGLDSLAERLKQKLEQDPTDGGGWALLARSYVELARHAEAAPIYEKAVTLLPDDAQLLADYADALGVLHDRKLAGKPELLIRRALEIDPRNVKALMLAGTVAFDRKDYAQAVTYWERARAGLSADAEPEVTQELIAGIVEARSLLGAEQQRVSPATVATVPPDMSRKADAITGKVRLATNLVGNGSSTDTLFVFARAVEGPPMPVAIVRATKSDLPFTFRLDDSNSPMPARKLSEAGTVVVVARLSKSGDAMPKSGDLEGISLPVKPGSSGITVVIDRELP